MKVFSIMIAISTVSAVRRFQVGNNREVQGRHLIRTSMASPLCKRFMATHINQRHHNGHFMYRIHDDTLEKAHCVGSTTYDMDFCVKVCELKQGQRCTEGGAGHDICGAGLFCSSDSNTCESLFDFEDSLLMDDSMSSEDLYELLFGSPDF